MMSCFKSEAGNHYFYSSKWRSFHYIMEKRQYVDLDMNESFEEYKKRKDAFFLDEGCAQKNIPTIVTQYSKQTIENNLSNTRQLLIEVTDGCNLSCKYCGYGGLYDNYDKRTDKKQDFDKVKTLIDFMASYWRKSPDVSYEDVVFVGFYGGEPLLNIELIKETIAYLETLELPVSFEFNMTSNAVLLNQYMDYLVEKKFHLLISLDGGKEDNAYRVRKDGAQSFDRIITNVQKLQARYPIYFEKYVEFSSVLHNKNSVESAISYIYNRFGKVPMVGELSTNGIAKDKHEEFSKMYSDKRDGFESFVKNCGMLKEDIQLASPQILILHNFLDAFVDGMYHRYTDLFVQIEDSYFIPTGTCSPFSRKIFLTVNGKLFPCEKIGQTVPLGYVSQGEVHLDIENIMDFYHRKFKFIKTYCEVCARWRNCGLCIYFLEEKDGNPECPSYSPINKNISSHLSEYISLLEEKPELYNKVLMDLKIS